MNAIILIVSVVAPLMPVVMFPTRFFGRGLGGTILGAALLVGAMMVIYVTMSATIGTGGDDPKADKAAKQQQAATDADMKALDQLLGN